MVFEPAGGRVGHVGPDPLLVHPAAGAAPGRMGINWMPSIATGSALNQVAQSRLPPQFNATHVMVGRGRRRLQPVRAGRGRLQAQHPGRLLAHPSSPLSWAQRASPFQALTASELDSWLLPSAKGAVPRPTSDRRTGRSTRRAGTSGRSAVRRCPRRGLSTTGAHLCRRRGRPRQERGGGEEVPVVEVVVVELLGAERRFTADHATQCGS